tara:strand:- start:316 stop:435 length:120 start_codon:yes stop_codon:yes gene_type:complete
MVVSNEKFSVGSGWISFIAKLVSPGKKKWFVYDTPNLIS